ncbi:MAG: YigZ family protein [Lachnospiraceae bacterium]|nr:YigZ family protein [Lachnospiraceae bacterium]
MSKSRYLALYKGGEGTIIEKKSRFIATIEPAETVEEAEVFIEKMKKKYWDARHNCHAFTVGVDMPLSRCSDDGEPSQTAGKPMLEVILGREIHNVVVVVTRYFGGTLLGTGGLVRAYTQAVQEGLKSCTLIEKCAGNPLLLTMDYTDLGKVQYLLAEMGILIQNTDYSDHVIMEALASLDQAELVKKKLIEATAGRIVIEEKPSIYFAEAEGEILIFD